MAAFEVMKRMIRKSIFVRQTGYKHVQAAKGETWLSSDRHENRVRAHVLSNR